MYFEMHSNDWLLWATGLLVQLQIDQRIIDIINDRFYISSAFIFTRVLTLYIVCSVLSISSSWIRISELTIRINKSVYTELCYLLRVRFLQTSLNQVHGLIFRVDPHVSFSNTVPWFEPTVKVKRRQLLV